MRRMRFDVPSGMWTGLKMAGIVTLLFVAAVKMASAQTSPLTPTADSYVEDGTGNTGLNFGTASTIEVKYDGGTSLDRRIFIKFDVAGIPAVSSAKIQLYGSWAADSPIQIWQVNDDSWSQSGLTWTNQPATVNSSMGEGSTYITQTTVNSTAGWYQWDITTWVQNAIAAGQYIYSFALETTTNSSDAPASFNSTNVTPTTYNPQLIFTVPAPTAPTVSAASISASEIDLTLGQGTTPGSTYTIFRSNSSVFTPVPCPGTGCNQIASVAGTTMTYPDTASLTAGTPYYYKVESVSAGGTSAASSEATATTHTQLPGGVAILVDPLYYVSGTCSALRTTVGAQVMNAVCDMQNDLQNVFGVASTVYSHSDETTVPNYATVPIIVVTGTGGTLHYNLGLTGTEVHQIQLVNGYHVATSPQRMVLQGADMRGTIYAIYEFSKSILGVPPLYYWTGWQPPSPAPSTIDIVPNYTLAFATPAVMYRGVYPVDSDMLTPWGLSTSDIGSANWNAYFATLLRLKYNLVDINNITDFPYSGGSPTYTTNNDQRAITCAERGLMVGFPHTNPLGSSYDDWTNYWTLEGQPSHANPTVADPASLDAFWKHFVTVAQNMGTAYGLEVLETITFRGDSDSPWYGDGYIGGDPGTDTGRANYVSIEMNNQLADLKAVTGQTNPAVRVMFYDETQDFLGDALGLTDGFTGSTFTPPTSSSDTNLIWGFSNEQRDHVPGPDARQFNGSSYNTSSQLVGYYMNPEYESTGAHITSDEGPWKVEANLRYIMNQAHSGNFAFSMLNLGNFREFTLEASAAADLLWFGPSTYTTDNFIENKFVPTYFAGASASAIDGLYSTYYNTILKQRAPDFPLSAGVQLFPTQYVFQDLRYYLASLVLLKSLKNQCYTSTTSPCLGVTPPAPFYDASGSYEPEEGTNPELGGCHSGTPTTSCVYYNIDPSYIDSGNTTNTVTAIMSATGSLGTTFANDYNVGSSSCTTVQGTLTTVQSYYFIDSLCSNVKLQSDLNFFLYHLAKADTEVGGPDATVVSTLGVAQTYLNNISSDLAMRYTNQSGTTIDGDFSSWYSNSTEFSISTLQADLCTALQTFGSGPTTACPGI